MVRALVVYCHPCEESFVAVVRECVVTALADAGHTVDLVDLYADGFDPRLSAQEHTDHRADPSTKPAALVYADRLRQCEMIVLVYPTWWGGQPAMLKGWLERTWVNGVSSQLPAGGGPPKALLHNVRRIVAVTTHGSSKWINAVEGEGGKRTVTRAMRASCGWRCRTRWLAMYGVDASTPAQRQQFLDQISRQLRRAR